MKALIKVFEVISTDKTNKEKDGVKVFEKMKSEYKKNNDIVSFSLDFEGVNSFGFKAFKKIIMEMKKNLQGNFGLEVLNANPFIKEAFKLAINN